MSLRRHKFNSYNRAKEHEENHWTDLLWAEEHHIMYDDYDWQEERDWAWFYMGAPYGYCNDVAEYHQMKLLTLLRKFAIRTAADVAVPTVGKIPSCRINYMTVAILTLVPVAKGKDTV